MTDVVNGEVNVIDLTTNTIVDVDPNTSNMVESIPVGDNARYISASGNRLYVANNLGGSVTVIDVAPTTPAVV